MRRRSWSCYMRRVKHSSRFALMATQNPPLVARSKCPTLQEGPPAQIPWAFKTPHPGQRLLKSSRPGKSDRPANPTGSGSKNRCARDLPLFLGKRGRTNKREGWRTAEDGQPPRLFFLSPQCGASPTIIHLQAFAAGVVYSYPPS